MNFEGAIGEIDLVERLVELSREKFTGAIRFEQDGIIKIVYFKGGDILSASTNDRKDAIDEILLRAGKISREHIKQALAKRQESETLGDALLNLGFITRKELTWARRVQVIGIIRSVRAWTTGNFAIVPDYLPKREEGTLFPLQQIIVEFIVTEQERQPFDRAMEGGEAIFRKRFEFDEDFTKLDLNDEANEITQQIDGHKSAAEIAVATGKDAFNVYKLLEALRLLGLIEKGTAKEEPKVEEVAFETGESTGEGVETLSAPPVPSMLDAPPISPTDSVPARSGVVMPAWDAPRKTPATATGASVERPAPAIPLPPQRKRTVTTAKVPPRRSRAPLYIVLALVLLGGAGYAGWIWWQQQQQSKIASGAVTTPPVRATAVPIPTAAPPPVTTSSAATSTTTTASTPSTIPAPMTTTIAHTATVAPPPHPPAATQTNPPAVASRLEKSPGGSTITNTPPTAAAPPTDGSREHYDAMARQYAQNASGNFTIQFELVCQPASVAKAIAAGGSSVWFVPTTYRGQSCYRVFWGHYDTREAAMQSVAGIPQPLRSEATPVVIAVPK